MLNVTPQIKALSHRALLCVAFACACAGSSIAGDVPKRELSAAAPGPHAPASAQSQEASRQEQLQRLALEAALVDSSAFGQLRMLRDVEAKVIESARAGGSEHCR